MGERIDHIDGMTIEEAEHQIATRLYQNTAKGHFDAVLQKSSRFGRRIVYGGHIISLARSLSFNGLANGCLRRRHQWRTTCQPGGGRRHDLCWSEILENQVLANRPDIGALRVRTVATKDIDGATFPAPGGEGEAAVLLDLDYWLLMPRDIS